jgi:hypothetical protein
MPPSSKEIDAPRFKLRAVVRFSAAERDGDIFRRHALPHLLGVPGLKLVHAEHVRRRDQTMEQLGRQLLLAGQRVDVHEPQQGSESVWLHAVKRDVAAAEQMVFEEGRLGERGASTDGCAKKKVSPPTEMGTFPRPSSPRDMRPRWLARSVGSSTGHRCWASFMVVGCEQSCPSANVQYASIIAEAKKILTARASGQETVKRTNRRKSTDRQLNSP